MEPMDNKTRNRILLVLFVGVLMAALDIAIVGPALHSIQRGFGVDDRAIAWVFSIYVLFNLIGTPLMAKLSDIYGRRAIYVLDVTIFAVGSLLVALSSSFAMLLVGRAIQGLGAGGIFPVASAVIGDTFPPEKRGGALGLIGAVFGIAFVIGPILGGILLLFGWQWLFVINLPIAVVVIVMSLRFLPTTHQAQRKAFDWAGMLTLGVLLASLAFGISQIDTKNFGASIARSDVWGFLLLTIVLLPVFWFIERKAQDPILHLKLFSSRQTVLASVLSAGAGLGEAALVFMPPLAVAGLGLTTSTSSFMLMPVVLAMAVGSPVAGRLLDRHGSKVVVLGGTALLTLGMILLGSFATSMALFLVAGIIVGLGLAALLGAPVRYIMLNEAPAADRTAAQGAITLFTSVGQLMSAAVVGAVAASQGGGVTGYEAAFMAIGVVALIMTLLTLGLKGKAAEQATIQHNRQVASTEVAQATQ
jgi:EmrB/QacA subfamily drug resistance transporter